MARIARPIFVWFTRNSRPPRITTVVTRITICVTVITAPPMWIGSAGSSCGKGLGFGFQMIIASVCSSSDMPIAVISGASLGALRSGR